jgi:cytoskeletal protein CcmA (bactofilin family)
MLNFNRNDRPNDVKDLGKPAPKPAAPYGLNPQPAPGSQTPPRATPAAGAPSAPGSPAPRESAPAPEPASRATSPEEAVGSKLIVGVNIKLKGVEISNCDVLVIEGQVEATVNSKAMEISAPGTLTGTAQIDVAEIHGEFSGELTARSKLVVHGTGRVTGTIRYGKLVVAEGGTLTGDLRQIDGSSADARPAAAASPAPAGTPDMRALLQTHSS